MSLGGALGSGARGRSLTWYELALASARGDLGILADLQSGGQAAMTDGGEGDGGEGDGGEGGRWRRGAR